MIPSPAPAQPALTYLFLDEPGITWDDHAREYVVPIRSRHDSHLISEERHKFRAQAIARALETAQRIEAAMDLRPSLTVEDAR
jgi:hypothetical protein